jgi:hypothetical protein
VLSPGKGGSAPVYGHALGHATYERHRPEQTLLYQLVEKPYPALVEQLEAQGAKANGFSLHAGVSCEGHQRSKHERLCRNIARPAVAIPRLSLSSTGKVVSTLKTPYRDGTTQVAFEGAAIRTVDFIARLAALARARSDQNPGSIAPATTVSYVSPAASHTKRADKSNCQGITL